MNTAQSKQFIVNSQHALNHLFNAIDDYNKVLSAAQEEVERIESAQETLSNLFMYRDQWSANANHHYAIYVERMKLLSAQKQLTAIDTSVRLDSALESIGATVESMSSLAGAILQIAKQVLALRHNGKPAKISPRNIGNQGIIEVIWEGRNHAMHWDEGAPRAKVKTMLDGLKNDLGIDIETGKNNCLSILGALGWSSTEAVVHDLESLI